jgi:hypothetical protein
MFTLEKNEVFEEHFMGNSSRDLFNPPGETLLQYRNATVMTTIRDRLAGIDFSVKR